MPTRSHARQLLGLPADSRAVLVVAGSWGVGNIEQTFDALVADGRYTPIVVCGTNGRLRRRLEAKGQGRILGWTDDMAVLMAAADALVENAGGLTCMEAFAAGLPVVSFLPIEGHGRENATAMARSGVVAYCRNIVDLVPTLDRVTGPSGDAQLTAAKAMFRGDAAFEIADLARAGLGAPDRGRRRSSDGGTGPSTAIDSGAISAGRPSGREGAGKGRRDPQIGAQHRPTSGTGDRDSVWEGPLNGVGR